MIILGVDPGLGGAVCFYDDTTSPVVYDIPTFDLSRNGKKKRDIDAATLANLCAAHQIGHAFIEQVGAMPGQGSTSMFAFGKAYGVIIGILAAQGAPMTFVTSRVWKKALGVPADKDGARSRASQLMPAYVSLWPLVKHDGRAEAALIAYWGARTIGAVGRVAA